MPPNENNRRMTRSQGKAKSSTSSAATKKPPSTSSAAKSSVAKSSVAATNANSSGTAKGRGGGRKPSTANSTAAVKDTNEIVTRVDLGLLDGLPKEERKSKLEQTKSKVVQHFRRLGLSDISTDLTSTDVDNLEACIQLSPEDFEKLIKEWAPGYQKGRVTKRSTLFDHLRKAVLPAPSLALIPSSKNDAKKKDDVSLRATFGSICGVPPLSTWTQKMMIDGIERQEDSESKGGDYHYTCLTDEDLSRKVGKRCAKRLAMVRKAWQHDNSHDYTKPSQVRNVTAIEPDIAPAAAPSLCGGIGRTGANVLGSSDGVCVVPPTPRNLQNGNGVVPPSDKIQAPNPSEAQAPVATTDYCAQMSELTKLLAKTQFETMTENKKHNNHMDEMQRQGNEMQRQGNEMQRQTNVAINEISENRNRNRIDGLEREQVADRSRLGAVENRLGAVENQVALQMSTLKTEFQNTVRKLQSSGSDSSSDNNAGDESNSESVSRRLFSVDFESNESLQQGSNQPGFLSGAWGASDAASGGGAHSDEVDEENMQATGAAITRNSLFNAVINEFKEKNNTMKERENQIKKEQSDDSPAVAAPAAEGGPDPEEEEKESKIGSTARPVLSEEEEEIASKYRKMLKFGIPKDTVRHDMKKEGVSQKIVEAILGKVDALDNGNNMETPAKGKNTKTKGIHWTANNLSQDLLEGGAFDISATTPLIDPEEADIKRKLEELFPKNDNKRTGKVKSGETNAGNEMAKLLDITRANNIAIQLKAFNDFTPRALAETINDLDPDSKIIGERAQFILQLLPTPKELQAIKKYKGESDKLNMAELFFQQLLPVKRAEDKVAVVAAMCTFNEHAEEARAGFNTLEEVCGQVMNSYKLKQILQMVLNIGNLMNEGSLDGGVEAFKFESLPKLSQTKSADGETTVLDYIVETFIEKGARETLLLDLDFPDIQESCRLSFNDLRRAANTLRKNCQLCKTELDSMKKDQSLKPAKGTQRKKIEGEAADPRKALFAAIQSIGTNDDDSSPKPTPVDPRQARFAAIKNKGAEASTTSTPGANVKYSRGVKRLESFIREAEDSLSFTERDQNAALRACKDLAAYCGEEGGERSASALLQNLSAFSSSLKAAVEKYDKRAELSKRQKTQSKRVPQKNDKENQVNAMPEEKQLRKASSLQPYVGLTDRVKRVSAGVDPNTSSLAIANSRRSPKTRLKQTSSNDGDARSAMFAAIKSRNQECAL